jgi:NAD(P)-dependent dehydrogenase (short-subunit alcohol dehydrogenase family)
MKHIITGASSGIGLAYLRYLIDPTYYDSYISSKFKPVKSTAFKDIIVVGRSRPQYACEFVEADFSKEQYIDLHELVCNETNLEITLSCGFIDRNLKIPTFSESLNTHFSINCSNQLDFLKQVVRKREGGDVSIVYLSSYLSKGSNTYPEYAVSKAAMEAGLRSIKEQYRNCKITVSFLYPGRVDTPGNPKRENLFYRTPQEVSFYIYFLHKYNLDTKLGTTLDLGVKECVF